jgi:isocitrate/isopropylmalate dehydrogenase
MLKDGEWSTVSIVRLDACLVLIVPGDQVFHQVKSRPEYSDVETDIVLVDIMTRRMVWEPHAFDTIVATNLHADILSDLAAALSGSLGIAPSSNLDPTKQNPSMFEPIHGSSPELAGKNIANPLGALWSCAEMIKWLGDEKAGNLMIRCIENVTEWGVRTRDLNGSNTTTDVTQAVCAEIERMSRLEL